MKVSWKNSEDWLLSIVYNSPQHQHRQALWDVLWELAAEIESPWAILGDFNSILHPHERSYSPPLASRGVDSLTWRGESTGEFFISSAYSNITQECVGENDLLFKRIWCWPGPERFRLLLWKIATDGLANYGRSLTDNLHVFESVMPFISLAVLADVSSTIFPRGF
uniref:Uncharacterized protein n=1 Tax=Cajanus cajan TaxID=3821 RepID=A0A151R097_CAJCA|nr:hypothetical protein KK1_042992 [Cajanus cajan]